jgi:hypothetical protein
MKTYKAKVSFHPVELGDESFGVSVEPLGGDSEVIPSNLYFEFPTGTTFRGAKKIADNLNRTIDGAMRIV